MTLHLQCHNCSVKFARYVYNDTGSRLDLHVYLKFASRDICLPSTNPPQPLPTLPLQTPTQHSLPYRMLPYPIPSFLMPCSPTHNPCLSNIIYGKECVVTLESIMTNCSILLIDNNSAALWTNHYWIRILQRGSKGSFKN